MNNVDEMLQLGVEHKWIPLAAILIGAIVRLLKGDTPLPFVPATWRPWLALALGAVFGVTEKIASGETWTKALVDGLAAALIAIAGHDLVIHSLRDGRELLDRKATESEAAPHSLGPRASAGG